MTRKNAPFDRQRNFLEYPVYKELNPEQVPFLSGIRKEYEKFKKKEKNYFGTGLNTFS